MFVLYLIHEYKSILFWIIFRISHFTHTCKVRNLDINLPAYISITVFSEDVKFYDLHQQTEVLW